MPPYFLETHFNIILQFTPAQVYQAAYFFSFPQYNPTLRLSSSPKRNKSCPSHYHRHDHPKCYYGEDETSRNPSRYFLQPPVTAPWDKYLPQHPKLEHPLLMLFLYSTAQDETPRENIILVCIFIFVLLDSEKRTKDSRPNSGRHSPNSI